MKRHGRPCNTIDHSSKWPRHSITTQVLFRINIEMGFLILAACCRHSQIESAPPRKMPPSFSPSVNLINAPNIQTRWTANEAVCPIALHPGGLNEVTILISPRIPSPGQGTLQLVASSWSKVA